MARDAEIFTYTLTNDSIVLTDSEAGVRKISVFNTTTTAGTVLGSKRLNALEPEAISIGEGETFALESMEGDVIRNITITAPSGCTLNIVAYI